VACLFAHLGDQNAKEFLLSLKQNEAAIEQGNKTCAEHVSAGFLVFALTDTDDAIIEVEAGEPVTIVYPDASDDALGVLFIPNTLALIKGAPHPAAAQKLIEYLLSSEVEIALAKSPSAQIPLNTKVKVETRVKTPKDVTSMKVDFNRAAEEFENAAQFIEKHFLK
jgi:iron(III) transport system substrate-binding protein